MSQSQFPAPDLSAKAERRSLFVSAGDPSGDIAGFHFLRSLRQNFPDLELFGLGGRRMKALGQQQLVPGTELAALGFWEVARHFPFFRQLFNRTLAEIERRRPSAVVLIDYPGFNLRLARRVHELGIPVIYYISPQVWAWGKRRIPLMRQVIDRLLVVFPFEVDFFTGHDIQAEYVGHYLLDDIPSELIGAPRDSQSGTIALLPGSRQQEVDRMLPVMLQAARLLNQSGDGDEPSDKWRFQIGGLSEGPRYDKILSVFPEFREALVYDQTRQLISQAALTITSSGTATLEVALIGCPQVVVYRTGFITYQIAKRLVDLPHIALANIIAGETAAPELIQGEASAENIAATAGELLSSREKQARSLAAFSRVREILRVGTGEQDSPSKKVAEIVAEYLR